MRISVQGIGDAQASFDNFVSDIEEKLAKGIEESGRIVEADAKALCPVSTEATRPGGPHGELRQSITSQSEGLTCEVGTNKEYAMYVEFGTYKMAAQPYLVPALIENEDKIVETVKAAIS